jgi:DNA-binding CsgD family transcriptional regulator
VIDDYTGTWPLLERERETAAVLQSMAAPTTLGVLVVGAAGVGKTAIAREVAASLDTTAYVLFIRGTASMSGTPYGALSVLFLDLETTDDVTGSILMLQSLRETLLARARGREVVLLVDNVQHLDDLSVMVLSFLAESRTARLLVTCERPAGEPDEFFELWRRGLLERVDLAPLTFAQSRRLLESLLGGALSGMAAVSLWRASRGSPRCLQAAVRDSMTRGRLVRSGNSWIWCGDNGGAGSGPRNDVLGALSGLSSEAREVLDVIVAVGPASIELLLSSCSAVALSELERTGLCLVQDEPPYRMEAVNDLIADGVRRDLMAGPRLALLQLLQRLDADERMTTSGRLNLLRWFLDTGTRLSEDYLVTMARLANEYDEPELALRAIGCLTDTKRRGVPEQLRALVDTGRIADGAALLERVEEGRNLDADERALLLCEQIRLLVRHPQDHRRAGEVLAELDRAVGAQCAPENRSVADRAGAVAVETAAYEGRFADLTAAEEASDTLRSDTAAALERAAHRLLARSVTGEGPGAPRLMARLRRPWREEDAGPQHHTVREQLFIALMLEGHLDDALSLAAEQTLASGSWKDPAVADTLRGCALAVTGQAKAGLEVLLPTIEQLRANDRSGLRALAEAAGAYCRALLGEEQDVHWVPPAGISLKRMSWTQQSVFALFATLVSSLLADSAAAARQFVLMADEQREAGHHGVELLLRMQAVRLGQHAPQQVRLLLSRAQGLGTPLAGACELFARGVQKADPHVLLEAAELSFSAGHWDLAGSAALLSMRLHDEEDEPLHFIRAEQIFRRTHVPRRNASARRILTERERIFARMAAKGATNKEIAAAYHLSVRTVEGHILKAMAKLGISSRKQLVPVFA